MPRLPIRIEAEGPNHPDFTMSFDKTTAMRNAERFLAQGKIRSAIGEYKQVVASDPKDFGTLNMLGDLYVKNSEKNEAIKCYQTVAEHYSKQGFAQKAIAVYNKISRLDPHSVEVSARLAELYKIKGSVSEAKSHYTTLAEHYQSTGHRIEALEVWKQIAVLDPSNTEVYLTLANAYLEENELDSAIEAFTNAGIRFAKKGSHPEAIGALEKAFEINPCDTAALSAFVDSKFALGEAEDAAKRLSSLLEMDPHNRDILQLMAASHLEAGDVGEAERTAIRLVEIEPSSYSHLLGIAAEYLKVPDADSATRMLSMASEHMLAAGKIDEFRGLVDAVLELDSEQIDALRLLVRSCAWQRDEAALCDSLKRLADEAQKQESSEDERFALVQLVRMMPQETKFSERLQVIKQQYGFDDLDSDEYLMGGPPAEPEAAQQFESFAIVDADAGELRMPAMPPAGEHISEFEPADLGADDAEAESQPSDPDETAAQSGTAKVSGEAALLQEIDSIKFYIENGYVDLASKAIQELYGEFGERPEIDQLRSSLGGYSKSNNGLGPVNEESADAESGNGFALDDLRAELGLEDSESGDGGDYDTRYHTAVAYQEMGLLEDAIKEFQDAVALVSPNDGTRRFFQCSNLLGHCFMQKGMPHLAVTWFQRSLETPGLSDDEKQGIWYELAAAYEAEGDMENAGRYFEQVYAENIDFRDVGNRIKNIAVQQ